MVTDATLAAQQRTDAGKSATRKLRAAGRTPAVLYGHGEQTRQLSLDSHELGVLFSRISVDNTIITLEVDGERGAALRALVREVQIEPASRRILHVDFYQVHAGERIEVEVPIHFVGTAAGVKAGGNMHPNFNALPVRCLAEQIPEFIEVDVSGLDIGDSLHIGQMTLPAGATTDLEPESVLCSVTPPTVVVAAEAAPEVTEGAGGPVEPELIRKRGEEGETAE